LTIYSDVAAIVSRLLLFIYFCPFAIAKATIEKVKRIELHTRAGAKILKIKFNKFNLIW